MYDNTVCNPVEDRTKSGEITVTVRPAHAAPSNGTRQWRSLFSKGLSCMAQARAYEQLSTVFQYIQYNHRGHRGVSEILLSSCSPRLSNPR
jgi:hypothetical protein